MTPWCPANKLEWYRVIILSVQISGIVNIVVSFSEVGVILNNSEINKMYCSDRVSTFLIAALELGNLFFIILPACLPGKPLSFRKS